MSSRSFYNQGPRQDSGSAGTKKVLDALENDTKANFQENIPVKVWFQKKWGRGAWQLNIWIFHNIWIFTSCDVFLHFVFPYISTKPLTICFNIYFRFLFASRFSTIWWDGANHQIKVERPIIRMWRFLCFCL